MKRQHLNPVIHRAHRTYSGVAEPRLDTFADVGLALHNYLMKTDENFAAASKRGKEINARRAERFANYQTDS